VNDAYLSQPSIFRDIVMFVSDDDLWCVNLDHPDLLARRLTTSKGRVRTPKISSDGKWVAYSSDETGEFDIYIIPSEGGATRRLTWMGYAYVAGWVDENQIVIVSEHETQVPEAYIYDLTNDTAKRLGLGPSQFYGVTENGAVVLGRNIGDPAKWKGYRGGTSGALWVKKKLDEPQRKRQTPRTDSNTKLFNRILIDLPTNIGAPNINGNQIYFVSDHEGVGNIYSCDIDGKKLAKITFESEFYVRDFSVDRQRLVYQAAGSLYLIGNHQKAKRLDIRVLSQWEQSRNRFEQPEKYLQDGDLDQDGKTLLSIVRGDLNLFEPWAGGVTRLQHPSVLRFKFAAFFQKGVAAVGVSEDGYDVIVRFVGKELIPSKKVVSIRTGKITQMEAGANAIAMVNSQNEVLVYDGAKTFVAGKSLHSHVGGLSWSPDSKWLAMSLSDNHVQSSLWVWNLDRKKARKLFDAVIEDHTPRFDASGQYLFFLGVRDIVAEHAEFPGEVMIPHGVRPYVVRLTSQAPSLFLRPMQIEDQDESGKEDYYDDGFRIPSSRKKKSAFRTGKTQFFDSRADSEVSRKVTSIVSAKVSSKVSSRKLGVSRTSPKLFSTAGLPVSAREPVLANGRGRLKKLGEKRGKSLKDVKKSSKTRKKISSAKFRLVETKIEFEGINTRIESFPSTLGGWSDILAAKERIFFLREDMRGAEPGAEERLGKFLYGYNLRDGEWDQWHDGVLNGRVSLDGRSLLLSTVDGVRLVSAESKPSDGDLDTRKDGWIDLSRMRLKVEPVLEWSQMYREAWVLQKEHFHAPKDVDWEKVYLRYEPLLKKVHTRWELSDVIRDMQGDLRTSHCYEYGGDYSRRGSEHIVGRLGAYLSWQEKSKSFRVERIPSGDSWLPHASSPLARLGVRNGDFILGIDGETFKERRDLERSLEHKALRRIQLKWKSKGKIRKDSLIPLDDLLPLNYRTWVDSNRRFVHEKSGGRLGYIHIPDMGLEGFAEFMRGFLPESQKQGLIIDARFNGGGFVSEFILRYLTQQVIGKDFSPRTKVFKTYPFLANPGPRVCVANEFAGSDGDIFCHAFKVLGIGPLIGTRTWGGTIGIWPRLGLVDGTMTSQPEFVFQFDDVGSSLENRGTDPDIEVVISPDDFARGSDTQLERAVVEGIKNLKQQVKAPAKSQKSKGIMVDKKISF